MALYQHFERVSKNCPFIWKALCLGPRKSSPHILHMMAIRGVIPGGAGGGHSPPTFGQQHFFRGFLTPLTSEVVLMGSFMSVIYGNV